MSDHYCSHCSDIVVSADSCVCCKSLEQMGSRAVFFIDVIDTPCAVCYIVTYNIYIDYCLNLLLIVEYFIAYINKRKIEK